MKNVDDLVVHLLGACEFTMEKMTELEADRNLRPDTQAAVIHFFEEAKKQHGEARAVVLMVARAVLNGRQAMTSMFKDNGHPEAAAMIEQITTDLLRPEIEAKVKELIEKSGGGEPKEVYVEHLKKSDLPKHIAQALGIEAPTDLPKYVQMPKAGDSYDA